jgi:hypothetical protein
MVTTVSPSCAASGEALNLMSMVSRMRVGDISVRASLPAWRARQTPADG